MFIFRKSDCITSYFKNGLLYKVKPDIGDLYENRDKYYNSRFIVLNGKKYDIENEKSICSIITPDFDIFSNTSLGVTGNLVYILRMKASILRDKGKMDVALTLLKKATEMMPVSNVGWAKKDYLRFADWLYEIGEPQEADKAVKCIDELFEQFDADLKAKTFQDAKSLDTDLVEATYSKYCCSECAKYRGRWFSISGKNTRFPKMPILDKCECQGLDFHPVIIDISIPAYCPENMDIIAYSNRPYIDDRTDEEKQTYEMFKREHEVEAWFEPYRKKLCVFKFKDEVEYKWICQNILDIAPKSLNGYRRMKNSNSKNFQKLVDLAKIKGYNLCYTQSELEELKYLNEKKAKYNKVKKECLEYFNSLKDNK